MTSKQFRIGRWWERVRTVPGLGRDTAALAGLIALGVTAAVLIQGMLVPTLPWQERVEVRAEFEEVPGVNPESGHQVTIAGVRVGQIDDWTTTDKGTAILSLDLEPGHRIYDNAQAVLRPKNPLNEMSVEISPGGPPGKPLPDNGLIPVDRTERAVQADEILQHLDERSQKALTDLLVQSDVALARAPEQLPGGLEATSDVMGTMKPVVKQLEKRRDKLSQLVTALAQTAAAVGDNDERLTKLIGAIQSTLDVLARNDGALQTSLKQLPGLSKDLRTALTSTQRLTKQLNPTLDDLDGASESLPAALERLRGTVSQLDKTVEAAKPVVAKAKPVVADLRPLISGADRALDDLKPVTKGLQTDTAILTKYLEPIRAFVYNTSSVFGAGESKTEGIIRGHLVIPPDGTLLPGGRGGWAPSPEESGVEGGN